MRLGYSTNAFVKFSIFVAVEKISQLGFGGIEIMCDRPHLYPPDFGPENLARLKGSIQKRGLRITNLNSFTLFAVGDTYLPSWIEPSEERRQIRIDHTLQCLKLASDLGCRNISVPPGGPLAEISRKKAFAHFYRGLEKVIPMAEQLSIKILVEPEPNLLLENSQQFQEFIREVRSPAVGLNFDIGHFFCAGEDPTEAFQELFQWIGHIHIEDIGPSRVHNHLIPGHGAINFLEIFKTMGRMNYKGDISLELYPYVDTPVEAGREGRAYLLSIFKEAGLDLETSSRQ
ncbi:MAG: sugar phosphate isomerase/epimerase family protein [Thermodesulfobacteriota bacterium]|jgi:sugar phosphate isomerase/epimerase